MHYLFKPSIRGFSRYPEQTSYIAEDRDIYNYQNEPELMKLMIDHQSIKLYEERQSPAKNVPKQVR